MHADHKIVFRALNFVALKYIGYGIAFLNQMLFISLAGVETYGVYSFFIFFLSVVAYSNGGVHFSYLVSSASKAERSQIQSIVYRSAIKINTISVILLSIVSLIAYYIGIFELEFFAKYHFTTYLLLILCAYFVKSFSLILMSRERIRNNWKKLNFYYMLPPLFEAAAIIVSTPENIVYNLLVSLILTHVSLIIFFTKPWNAKRINVNEVFDYFTIRRKVYRDTLFRGLEQNVYNLSFYGILMLVRGLASVHLSVEEFGQFSFSLNLATAIILFSGSIQFLVQPNLISSISTLRDIQAFHEILNLRRVFLLLTSALFFSSGVILWIAGQWSNSLETSVRVVFLILMAQLFFENVYGINTFLIQRNRERLLTVIGASIIITIFLISAIGPVQKLDDSLDFCVILSVSYAIYSFSTNLIAQKIAVSGLRWSKLFEIDVTIIGILAAATILYTDFFIISIITGCIIIFLIIVVQKNKLRNSIEMLLGLGKRD